MITMPYIDDKSLNGITYRNSTIGLGIAGCSVMTGFPVGGFAEQRYITLRSSVDTLHTSSSKNIFRDHDCFNVQHSATVNSPDELRFASRLTCSRSFAELLSATSYGYPGSYPETRVNGALYYDKDIWVPRLTSSHIRREPVWARSVCGHVVSLASGSTPTLVFGADPVSCIIQSNAGRVNDGDLYRFSCTANILSTQVWPNGQYLFMCLPFMSEGRWDNRLHRWVSPCDGSVTFGQPSYRTRDSVYRHSWTVLTNLLRSLFGHYSTMEEVLSDYSSIAYGAQMVAQSMIDYTSPYGSFLTATVSSRGSRPSRASIASVRAALDRGFRHLEWTHSLCQSQDDGLLNWSLLAAQAVGNCQRFDGNLIAYWGDLLTMRGEIEGLGQLLRSAFSAKGTVSLWLSGRYGMRLTASDTKSLVTGFRRKLTSVYNAMTETVYDVQRSRSSGSRSFTTPSRVTNAEVTRNYKVYYTPRPGSLLSSVRKLMEWDIWPSLENCWDLVPYSFVIDWFVDVSSLLASIDSAVMAMYYDVESVVSSEKSVETIDADWFSQYSGLDTFNVVVTRYSRGISHRLPPLQLSLQAGHLSTVNWVDGLSLIIQRS